MFCSLSKQCYLLGPRIQTHKPVNSYFSGKSPWPSQCLPFTLLYHVSSSKCKSTNELLRFGENRRWSVFPAQDFPKCILCTSDLTESLELSNKSHLNLSLSFCIGNLIYMFHMSIFLSPRGHRTYIPCETEQNVYSTTGKKRPSKIMQTHFYSVGEYDFKLCEFCLCCICLSL